MEYFQSLFLQIFLEFFLIYRNRHLDICFLSRCQFDLFVIFFKMQIIDLVTCDLVLISSFLGQLQIFFGFFGIFFHNICYQFCPFWQTHIIWHFHTDRIVLLFCCINTFFCLFLRLFFCIRLLFRCLCMALCLSLCSWRWSFRWCFRSWCRCFCRRFCSRRFCSRCFRRCFCGWCLGRSFCGWRWGFRWCFRSRCLSRSLLCLRSNFFCLCRFFLSQSCHADI